MTTLIITLPPPPTVLNPNRTSHWRTKAKAVKQYRNDAHIAAYAALNEMDRWHSNRPQWKQAVMTPKFYFRERRRRDRDNFQASLKAACDGLVDAGVLLDDSALLTMPAEFEIDPNAPRVELHLAEATELESSTVDEVRTNGVRCPRCGIRPVPTNFTRYRGDKTVRVRTCRKCGQKIRTFEVIEAVL